jgi:D-alanyl-D-alanine carboxypeptidase
MCARAREEAILKVGERRVDEAVRKRRNRVHAVCAILAFAALGATARAQTQSYSVSLNLNETVDQIAQKVLADTGVPSASVAVIDAGRAVYVHAYGEARLDPPTPARPEMRYSIGSISKQFTATAMLMLMEQGKVSLDDPAGKFLPDLTRANEVTIRELLSHTSGYQDYWPQDYVPLFMTTPITAPQIIERWAHKPLDFDPGTKWQYSNTNYVIAGVIIEKITGEPLLQFLQEKIFTPLQMQGVANVDQKGLGTEDAAGYLRYALGPPRPAPKEGPGWLFAAGELAMPVGDLVKWDIAMLQKKLLLPDSYELMQREVRLKTGEGTGYALGLSVGNLDGHRVLRHGGEVSGYVSENFILPDDGMAVAVLTNQDASSAAGQIADRIAQLLVQGESPAPASTLERDRAVFEELQRGKIDRSLFTDNANAYFTEQALRDYASSLGGLGVPQEFAQVAEELRGGMTFRAYHAGFRGKNLTITIYEMPDGKIEQYLVHAAD